MRCAGLGGGITLHFEIYIALALKTDISMRLINAIFWFLFIVSLFFLGESVFEAYGLTLAYGSQMLFFSAAETWPAWLLNGLFISWFAFYACLAAGLAATATSFFHGIGPWPRVTKATRITFVLLAIHFVALSTYDHWSTLFDH